MPMLCRSPVTVSCRITFFRLCGYSCWLPMLPVMLQVSCDDPDEYKRTLRGQLRALLEREKDPLGPAEWVVCHVKQATPSDGLLKGPRKVRCCQSAPPPSSACLTSLLSLTGQGSCHVQQCTAAAALLPAEAHMLLLRQSMLDSAAVQVGTTVHLAAAAAVCRSLRRYATNSSLVGGSAVCGWSCLQAAVAPLLDSRTWSVS